MATLFSDELTRLRAGRNYRSNEMGGKFRILKWDFASLPVGNIGDILLCGLIRKDERVVLGREYHSAMGGTATGAYSTFTPSADKTNIASTTPITAGKYQAAVTYVAAGSNFIASTLAENSLAEETLADVMLGCVNASTAFATAGRVAGFLLLVAD